MDRDRLARWLGSGHRTLRWSAGSRDGYEAVETTDQGLVWYRWSHRIPDGGERDRELQSFEDFEARGALRSPPDAVLEQLRALVRARRGR